MMKAVRFMGRRWARKHQTAVAAVKWTLSIGSAALTIYVLDYFLPVWLTAAIASTVIVHELGHYVTARRLRRKADPPLFVPFIWGVISGTRIHNRGSDPIRDAQIHLNGPTWGFIWSVAGACFSIWFGQEGMMWAFLWLAAANLYHGTIGSDGRFYQSMKPTVTPHVREDDYVEAVVV